MIACFVDIGQIVDQNCLNFKNKQSVNKYFNTNPMKF